MRLCFFDLPGIYGLRATTVDERVARDYVLWGNWDALLVLAAYAYATFGGSYDFTLMMPHSAQGVVTLHYLTNNYRTNIMYPDYVVAPNLTTLERINQTISNMSCIASTQLLNSSKPILKVTLSVYPLEGRP